MPHPPVDPYETGMLEVGDGHVVYYEVCGDPGGVPLVVLHGGPGGGCSAGMRRWFDPSVFRIVLLDQRGCGRSRPLADAPGADLSTNTTAHLVADLELLRGHLGIGRWLVSGVSWGSTLGLAYAQAHPSRVLGVVLMAVTTTRRREVDWITHDAGRIWPEEFDRLLALLPEDERSGNVPAAFHRLLMDPDPRVHQEAARAWCAWERTLVSWPPAPSGGGRRDRYDDPAFRLVFARLVTHYFGHDGFLAPDQLLREAHRLAGIPGVLVHGRVDLQGPLDTAWRLARAWPDAELRVVEDEGHGGPSMLEEFAQGALRLAERYRTTPG